MRWVQLHPTNISQKVQIIVEHFHANVAHLLEGKAKAMVVTDSRKAAVKYKKAIDAYIAKRAARTPRTTTAPWSRSPGRTMAEDEVWAVEWGRHRQDDEFTEANLNPGAGADLAAAFKGDDLQDHAGRQQVPDRLRPAAALGDVRRQEAVRRHRRADAVAAQPHPPHRRAASRSARRSSSTSSTSPRTSRPSFEPYFKNATLETETDPYVVVAPRHQARPGRHLHRGRGPQGRRAVGHPQGQQRALRRDQPGPARLRSAATPARSTRTTRSPSTPSTCSARTSPPTCGSTTS